MHVADRNAVDVDGRNNVASHVSTRRCCLYPRRPLTNYTEKSPNVVGPATCRKTYGMKEIRGEFNKGMYVISFVSHVSAAELRYIV